MGLEKINQFKKEKNMTNKMLSELSGVPKSSIDKITAGINKNPALETVKAIAHAMGKTLDDIMSSENPPQDLTVYAIDEDGDTVEKLTSEQAAEYLDELLALPIDALGEYRIVMEYLRYKYGRGDGDAKQN